MSFYEKHQDERDRFEILAFHDGTAKTFEELDRKTRTRTAARISR